MAARKPKPTPWEAELVAEVARIEKIADGAEAKGSWQAATGARAKVVELKRDLARLREERGVGDEDGLARLSRLRRKSAEEGSWTAVAQLLRQEEELRAQREAEAREASLADARTDDEIVADLVDALRSLPEHLRRRVVERADAVDLAPDDPDEDEDGSDP